MDLAIRNEIKLLAIGLAINDNISGEVCPFCRRDDDKAFSVRRTSGGVLYRCFRVSCIGNSGGFISSYDYQPSKTKREFIPKYFTNETINFTKQEIKEFYYKYHMIPPKDWKMCLNEDRMVAPMVTFTDYIWGHQTKLLRPATKKERKSILYTEAEFPPRLHFPHLANDYKDGCVLVEDTISATRVPNGIALLGTDLNTAAVLYLKSCGITKVKVALDKDAWKKAIAMRNKYHLSFPDGFTVLVWKSGLDPKDMNDEEFNEVFK